MKILLVDDNANVRKMIRSLLGSMVDEIVECSDGSEAIDAYRIHEPDWVLMDIEMAGTDGITATRQLKAAFPDARIIIVTNYGDLAIRESARMAGAYEYVLKEDLKHVQEIIRNVQPHS